MQKEIKAHEERIDKAACWLHSRLQGFAAQAAVVLGSGFGAFAEEQLAEADAIPYQEIPGFPVSTAPGHKGLLWRGIASGCRVLVLQGRFHYYEGWSPEEVTLPIRVLSALGVPRLVLTNAAGGIREDLQPGDLLLIRDHLNFLGFNPLIGPNLVRFGPRFPDMSNVYDGELRALAKAVAAAAGISLKEGVYLATTGPSFETPAEIKAFRLLGADVVGMSTVPEAIVARHVGIKVLAFSCVTNKAAGLAASPLTEEEVFQVTAASRSHFTRLLQGVLAQLA